MEIVDSPSAYPFHEEGGIACADGALMNRAAPMLAVVRKALAARVRSEYMPSPRNLD
jgi:hypothetical protein